VIIKNTKKGFTLIELLMVVVIIVILATIVIISIREATDRGKNTKIITSMVQIRKLSEDMYLQRSDGYDQLCDAGNTLNETYSNQLQILEEDINSFAGTNPTCYSSDSSYCVSVQLVDEDWFCIDDNGNNEQVSSNPCSVATSTCR